MPDRKINFCSKFAIKIFRTTIADTDTGSLRSLHTLFDTYLDYMLTKFEANRMVQNVENVELFDKKKNNNKFLKRHF